jgi:hypothetical protein
MGAIDEKTIMNLERVWTTTMFNCLSVAMDSSYVVTNTLSNKELRTNKLSLSFIGKLTTIKH